MLFKPFIRLWREGRLLALAGVDRDLKSFYRLSFLAAAGREGLLERLASGAATLDALVGFYGVTAQGRDALEAWLQLGIRLRLLILGRNGYELRGLASKLARQENDAVLAMVEEVVELHHKLITATVPKLRSNELWTLADQDGELIARSSRILEAFQAEMIERTFPKRGATRLLEIGCGSGIYLRYAAQRNSSLTAVGVELQRDVADMARRNLREWRLETRVTIETDDIREKEPDGTFDIATLYNNIYYFPFEERVALLEHVRKFLKPGGFLQLMTCCQGGSVGSEALNLWAAATRGAGRLPTEAEMVQQLREAGYNRVKTSNLVAGERFVAFQAFRG